MLFHVWLSLSSLDRHIFPSIVGILSKSSKWPWLTFLFSRKRFSCWYIFYTKPEFCELLDSLWLHLLSQSLLLLIHQVWERIAFAEKHGLQSFLNNDLPISTWILSVSLAPSSILAFPAETRAPWPLALSLLNQMKSWYLYTSFRCYSSKYSKSRK